MRGYVPLKQRAIISSAVGNTIRINPACSSGEDAVKVTFISSSDESSWCASTAAWLTEDIASPPLVAVLNV